MGLSMVASSRSFFGKALILEPVTEHHIPQLRKLHQIIFPLAYRDSFFADLSKSTSFSFMILLGSECVGCICGTIFNESTLYIKTIGILPYFRNSGIGSYVLSVVIEDAQDQFQIKLVELHVQEGNQSALKFYQKYGFAIEDRVEKYYKRIEQNVALLLRKHLQY